MLEKGRGLEGKTKGRRSVHHARFPLVQTAKRSTLNRYKRYRVNSTIVFAFFLFLAVLLEPAHREDSRKGVG